VHVARFSHSTGSSAKLPDGGKETDMKIARQIITACTLTLVSIGANSVAAQLLPADQPAYRVTYNVASNHYCIRAYKNGSSGETKALGNGLNCRSKRAWERAGLKFVRVPHDPVQVARRDD
jgi:hypothetical protein